MKKAVVPALLLMVCVMGYHIVTAAPGSRLFRIKQGALDWLDSIGISKADYEAQLRYKTAELEAYERAHAWADAEVARMENTNGPVCPITGTSSKVKVTSDPRPEINEKINKLKEEIASLRKKMKD